MPRLTAPASIRNPTGKNASSTSAASSQAASVWAGVLKLANKDKNSAPQSSDEIKSQNTKPLKRYSASVIWGNKYV
jgi:hypothetical protein